MIYVSVVDNSRESRLFETRYSNELCFEKSIAHLNQANSELEKEIVERIRIDQQKNYFSIMYLTN